MDFGIAGKIALVTGASQGLGKACARALADEGCTVVLLARNAERLAATASELTTRGAVVHTYAADLTDRSQLLAQIRRIREDVGSPDILVYNNGGARDVYFDEATDEDFLHAYNILVMGFVWCLRAVLPDMKSTGWGRIVTLGSLCAREPHREFPMVLHNLGRPAQLGLSKTLANQVGNFGITINTIATGMIDHDGQSAHRAYTAHARDRGLSDDEVQQYRIANIPVGRMGHAYEIGSLCAYLCSDQAGFMTGQTILMDGGRVAALV